jgi:phosphate transport system permease protein
MNERTVNYNKSISYKAKLKDKVLETLLMLVGSFTFFILVLIFIFLLSETINGLKYISIMDYFYSPTGETFRWNPTGAPPHYSLIPLLMGSLLTALPATLISALVGICVGIYISEIANYRMKEILKPFLDFFNGIPTVVLGFLLVMWGGKFLGDLFDFSDKLNAFLASIGLSIIIIPTIATLTEDALNTVPDNIRIAAYSLGANKWQTISKILLPVAIKGGAAGIILGFGRAIGETMIVIMASGNAGELTFNIFKSVRTLTATIAAEMGEVSQYSSHYYALFFIGLFLFVVTFLLNLIADLILSKVKKEINKYE